MADNIMVIAAQESDQSDGSDLSDLSGTLFNSPFPVLD
jgi:hypothetical protein